MLTFIGLLSSFLTTLAPIVPLTKKQMVEFPIASLSQSNISLALSHIDILGTDFARGTVQARVSDLEIWELSELGVGIRVLEDNAPLLGTRSLNGYIKPVDVPIKLRTLASSYPTLTKAFEFGRSVDGAPLVALEISSQQQPYEKPVVFFNALHHARELMSTEILLHMSEVLLSKYQSDAKVRHWVDTYRIVIVPQVNPDGHALVHSGYAWWRKNTAGRSVMYGVDLNRNYPTLWNACQGSSGIQSDDTYRGPNAASEPETQAMLKLFENYRPVANISYHTYAEAILYPFGCAQSENPADTLFKQVGNTLRAAIVDDNGQSNTYRMGTAPQLLYNADGGDNDTHWQQFGTVSFAIEAGSAKQGFQPEYSSWRDLTVARQEGGWRALLNRMDHGAVRAVVRTNNPAEISYTLKSTSENFSAPTDFSTLPVLPFRLKNAHGFLYQWVLPGERTEISFYRGGQLVKTLSFEANNDVVDLGTITL